MEKRFHEGEQSATQLPQTICLSYIKWRLFVSFIFARANQSRRLCAMEVFCIISILLLSVTSGQDVQEPPVVITTENFEFPTEKPTEVPNDNGMALPIPERFVPEPPTGIQGKEEEPHAVEVQPVVVAFPENHKNFTPSEYLGEGDDFPPYYNHLNSYQQQYKNYYEQKAIFNRKPIKFEENSLKNFYLPTSAVTEEEKKVEEVQVNRTPFPYVFEKEQGDAQGWYQNAGHVAVQPTWYRGQRETVTPYYVNTYTHPHDGLYKDEVLYDHHQVKEKGSPWKKVFHVLTALVPLGLLLATLTPNVISINATTTGKTSRQAVEDTPPFKFGEKDVIRLMKKYGVDSLSEMQCEDRVICELAREGGNTAAGAVEKGFWFLANQTPWDVAEKAGMNELFKAIKSGNCEVYKCHSKTKRGFGKKLIRRHKVPE